MDRQEHPRFFILFPADLKTRKLNDDNLGDKVNGRGIPEAPGEGVPGPAY